MSSNKPKIYKIYYQQKRTSLHDT